MNFKPKVSLIGTLSPVLGTSDTGLALIYTLKDYVDLEFISFRRIYPNFLHPSKEKISKREYPMVQGVKIQYIMSYENPISWITPVIFTKSKIIHLQWWTPYLFLYYLPIIFIAKLRKKKIILQLHNIFSHESKKWEKPLTLFIFSIVDFIVVHSEKMKEEILAFGFPQKKVFVAELGSLHIFGKSLDKREARRKLNLPDIPFIFFFFGNIRRYKGLEILLASFSLLVKENKNILLFIVGRVWGNKEEYLNKIKELNLQDYVKTHFQFVPDADIPVYFSAVDCVVLPYTEFSSQSGIGRIALYFEKPMIVTSVGALPSLTSSHLVIPPGDKNALFEIMKKILDKNFYEEQVKIIRTKKMGWEKTKETLLEIYQKCQKV